MYGNQGGTAGALIWIIFNSRPCYRTGVFIFNLQVLDQNFHYPLNSTFRRKHAFQ